MKPDARLARWVDVTTDILLRAEPGDHHAEVQAQVFETFDITAVSWNWRNADGAFGHELYPDLGWGTDPTAWPDHVDLAVYELHPVLRWYTATGDPDPQSIGRVPMSISPQRERDQVREVLEPLGCEEQLSIPYVLDGLEHRAFVLARPDRDFDDDDLEVARRLQPLFYALAVQDEVLNAHRAAVVEPGAVTGLGLTGRELTVLQLLADGGTAECIGRRLGISARTVHKHLENTYRKLGVTDRLSAVRVAANLGLVSAAWSHGHNGARATSSEQNGSNGHSPSLTGSTDANAPSQ